MNFVWTHFLLFSTATSAQAKVDEPSSLVLTSYRDSSNQASVFNMGDPGKVCPKLPNLPNYTTGRKPAIDMNGVLHVLSDKVIYKYDPKMNAWVTVARVSVKDNYNMIIPLSKNRYRAREIYFFSSDFPLAIPTCEIFAVMEIPIHFSYLFTFRIVPGPGAYKISFFNSE